MCLCFPICALSPEQTCLGVYFWFMYNVWNDDPAYILEQLVGHPSFALTSLMFHPQANGYFLPNQQEFQQIRYVEKDPAC